MIGDKAIASATCFRRDAIGGNNGGKAITRLASTETRSVVTIRDETIPRLVATGQPFYAIAKVTCFRRDAIAGMRLVIRR